ncbi:solute carrier family 23 member 2-like isoform X2 [Ostrea edulis]|uniref:solute carrier family 23 member 2-like isoform X2 n=1 Tax=Ostrea edulis TaxID=37623 RepID=UPI0024AF642A|nr:solute carrier family 23 member 2-like isoform X2 [Ostrea edulis]
MEVRVEDDQEDREGRQNQNQDLVGQENQIIYSVEEAPPPHLTLVFALQQAILAIGSTLSIPFILTNLLCSSTNADARAQLLSISMFMCGIATVLQTTLGVRLGIIQGGSHNFLAPIIAMMTLEKWKCTEEELNVNDPGKFDVGLYCPAGSGMYWSHGVLPEVYRSPHYCSNYIFDWTLLDRSSSRYKPVPLGNRHTNVAADWNIQFIYGSPKGSSAKFFKSKQVPHYKIPDLPAYAVQFGMPTVSAAGFAGMLAATISSVIESVGDYFAAARLSNAEAPPPHAVNRGIAIEGFSSIISGMVGAGHPTTSYSGNIGAIGITKVASRRVFQVAGVILLLSGIIGKFGAVLTLIPDPIIGGTLTVVFGMVGAVGISVLQFMDMSSTRNLTILALSMILGLMVPQWLLNNPNSINTGSEDLDQVLEVLLTTAMFVGGLIGFILDNTVPGSKEERGLSKWRETLDSSALRRKTVQYNLPLVTTFIQRMKCCAYFPISPTFNKSYKNCCTKSKKQKTYELSDVKTRQENGSSEMEGK